MNIKGWCVKHGTLVDSAKHRTQCRVANKGKPCRWFEHKVPEYKRKWKRKVEGKGKLERS